MSLSCCAARPKNKRMASSPALLLGKKAENGVVEIRKAPKPIEKEKVDYAVEDYNHIPALNIPTDDPESILGLAAQGDATVLRFVINSKADQAKQLVNEQALVSGTTPLLAAAKGGHTRCIEVLLEYGADVNQPNEEGWTPLMAAVRFANRDTTRLLLKHNADARVQLKGRPIVDLANSYFVVQDLEKATGRDKEIEEEERQAEEAIARARAEEEAKIREKEAQQAARLAAVKGVIAPPMAVAVVNEVLNAPPVLALNNALNPNGEDKGIGGGLRDLLNPKDYGLGSKTAPHSFNGGS